MANEIWKFAQVKGKQVIKQVLGIKDKAARMRVTLSLAVALLAHGEDMLWHRKTTASMPTPKDAERPGATASGATQNPQ